MLEGMYAVVTDGVRYPVAIEVLAKLRSIEEKFGYPLSLRCTKNDVRGYSWFVQKGIFICRHGTTDSCEFRVVLRECSNARVRDNDPDPSPVSATNEEDGAVGSVGGNAEKDEEDTCSHNRGHIVRAVIYIKAWRGCSTTMHRTVHRHDVSRAWMYSIWGVY